jgi:prepilin-type processing-associated H-X9-DG protein
MSNLKQDSLAMLMYVQDYDEMLPPMSQWMDRSNPYLHKNSRTLQCPEVSNASRGNASKFGYAGNSEISEKSMSTIAHPESTLLIYDSTNVAWNAHDARKTLAARHEGKVGIGFLDGHAGMPPLPMR